MFHSYKISHNQFSVSSFIKLLVKGLPKPTIMDCVVLTLFSAESFIVIKLHFYISLLGFSLRAIFRVIINGRRRGLELNNKFWDYIFILLKVLSYCILHGVVLRENFI